MNPIKQENVESVIRSGEWRRCVKECACLETDFCAACPLRGMPPVAPWWAHLPVIRWIPCIRDKYFGGSPKGF